MIDMKKTRKPKTLMDDCSCDGSPEYPWGLSITLDAESLDKLGIPGVMPVGDEVIIYAKAKVTVATERDTDSGKERSVELQIREMEPIGKKKESRKEFYES